MPDEATCCSRSPHRVADPERAAVAAAAAAAEHEDVAMPAGVFTTGEHHGEGYPDDGENVSEWCADRFSPTTCPGSTSSCCGFRTVVDATGASGA